MFASGEHEGHRFIVLEMCGPTLESVMNSKKLQPLPRRHIQEIAFQLFQGLACTSLFRHQIWLCVDGSYLDLHSLGLIHTDVKLDNIAIKSNKTVALNYFDPSHGFLKRVRDSIGAFA